MARILLIGATGVFGGRLAAHLAREPGLELLLGSRSLARAEALCGRIAARPETRAALRPVALDLKQDVAPLIHELSPRIVVDCSGPFQSADYRLPEAALRAGCHVVDLADARGYILGFAPALDALARERGLVALTGASTSPALAAAAVSALTEGWRRIDHIAVAIVPGGRSDTGDAAIKAALSYCGRSVPIVAAGRPDHALGWSGGERIAVPGLGSRRVAPVETADAELLAQRFPGAVGIRFMAGLESPLEQEGMRLLSFLRRFGLKPEALAPLMPPARRLTRLFTGERGGMVVRTSGIGPDGRWREARWTLVASGNQGPHVPPAPAAAAVRAILAGDYQPGARPCLDLPFAAIEHELAPYAITIERDSRSAGQGLLEVALAAEDLARLPPIVARFHALDGEALWSGEAAVEGSGHPLGRLVAGAFGFPGQADTLPVSVTVERESPGDGLPPGEIWTRRFGAQRFHSRFRLSGRAEAWERFGPFTFRIGFMLDAEGRLAYPVTAWRFSGLPLPLVLAPRSDAMEWQDADGRFRFDVGVSLPLLGRLFRYRGWLRPVLPPKPQSAQSAEAFS
jgi:hypothetical protein